MTHRSRRRRSCLSVPAGDQRKVSRALDVEVDEIVFDLEDSIPIDGKDTARDLLVTVSKRLASCHQHIAVRVNAPGSPWCTEDLVAAAGLECDVTVIVPKVESAGDVHYAGRVLEGAEARLGRSGEVDLQLLIETPKALSELTGIVEASSRTAALIIGYADLAASFGRRPDVDVDWWLRIQDRVIEAARATGIQAIDGPFLAPDTCPGFRAAVARAAQLGFDGKWIIHPRQAVDVNAAFTPDRESVEYACGVLRTLEEARVSGRGAVVYEGRMVDEAVAVGARRILLRAGQGASCQT